MKRLMLLALAACPALLFAQDSNFLIKGKVGSYNAPAKVYLLYMEGGENEMKDSAVLKDGAFAFKGSVAEPVPGVLILDSEGVGLEKINPQTRPDILNFYVEAGEVTVGAADSLKKAKVSGKTNAENQKLKDLLKPVHAKLLAFNDEYMASSPEQKKSEQYMNGMRERYEVLSQEQNEVFKKFVTDNPASYVSVSAIRNVAGSSPDPNPAEIEPLINTLSAEVKKSSSLKPLLSSLAAVKKTSVGAPAPDFTQADPDGKPVKLSDFRGKYVLLDFWASWCGPCREENPNVVKAYNAYKDKNFTVLGVSLDQEKGKEAWLKAIKDDGLTWSHVSDLKFWKNEVAVLYGVRSIPKNYLIDPQGKIIATDLRGEELQAKLQEVLK